MFCILYSDMILDIAVEIITAAVWLSRRDDSQVEASSRGFGSSLNIVALVHAVTRRIGKSAALD